MREHRADGHGRRLDSGAFQQANGACAAADGVTDGQGGLLAGDYEALPSCYAGSAAAA